MKASLRKAIDKYQKTEKGKSAVVRAVSNFFKTDKGRLQRALAVQRYNLKKKGLVATLTVEEWEQILADFGGRCAYCGKGGKMVREHFVPVSKGGGYTKYNIVPACQTCNGNKRDKYPQVWLPAETYRRITRYLMLKAFSDGVTEGKKMKSVSK